MSKCPGNLDVIKNTRGQAPQVMTRDGDLWLARMQSESEPCESELPPQGKEGREGSNPLFGQADTRNSNIKWHTTAIEIDTEVQAVQLGKLRVTCLPP